MRIVLPALTLLLLAACSGGPERSLERGKALFAEGKFEDAAIEYRKAMQKNPQSGAAFYGLAQASLKLGRLQDAYPALVRANELMPADAAIRIELAEATLSGYLASPDRPAVLYERVRKLAAEELAAHPNSAQGLRFQAYLLLLDSKPLEAVPVFERAVAADPKLAPAAAGLAEAYLRGGKAEEGQRAARQAVEGHPGYAPAYDLLYGALLAAGRTAEAEEVIRLRARNNPKDATPLLQLAGHQLAQRKPAEAAATLEGLLARRVEFPEAALRVGLFYANTGNLQAAAKAYRTGIDSDSDTKRQTECRRRLAGVFLQQGKMAEAETLLDQAIQAEPRHSPAQITRVRLLLASSEQAKRERGRAQVPELIQQFPNDFELRMLQGGLLESSGNAAGARLQYSEAARLEPGAITPPLALAGLARQSRDGAALLRHADAALALHPQSAYARYLRIVGLRALGENSLARIETAKLVREYPNSMDARLQLAAIAMDERRFADAERELRQMYRPGQADLRPLEALIDLQLMQGLTESAAKFAAAALSAKADSVPAALLVARTAIAAGRPQQAETQIIALAERFPNAPSLRAALADVKRLRGELDGARAALEKVRALAPDYPGLDATLASVEEQAGRLPEALALYRKALARDQENPLVANNAAYLIGETGGDLNEAVNLVQSGLRRLPRHPALRDTLAGLRLKQGQTAEAQRLLEPLVKEYPANAAYRYRLGAALAAKGDRAAARAELTTALAAQPSPATASAIRSLLAKTAE